MNDQIARIKTKLKQLQQADKSYSLFGAQIHRYKLNAAISLDGIRLFESRHNIKLPEGYVEFLTKIGNGGAGPFYGLEPLQHSLYIDLDYPNPDFLLNPALPFPHTDPWNMSFETSADEDEEEYDNERSAFEEKYFDSKHMNGALAICNYGCAVSLHLVVNGDEYGNIWTDDRTSDQGIYPSYELGNKEKITFLNWYELWLDNSLNEIKASFSSPDNAVAITDQTRKLRPWWKIW